MLLALLLAAAPHIPLVKGQGSYLYVSCLSRPRGNTVSYMVFGASSTLWDGLTKSHVRDERDLRSHMIRTIILQLEAFRLGGGSARWTGGMV